MRAHFGRLKWRGLLRLATPWLLAAASPMIHAQEAGSDAGHVLIGYSPYPKQELDQFVAKARAAEALKTPYARCVKAPDPPGMEWTVAVVEAYCRYRNHKVITFDEVRRLVDAGHADEVDARMQQALKAQQTESQSNGLLDFTYETDFRRVDPQTRKTIDAWKAQLPQSAYALAASGFVYSWAAAQARGSQSIRDTPPSQIREMDRLLALSNAELEKAARINPDITPIYTTLLDNSTMDDLSGETSSSRRGLAHAPADYDIYRMLMRAAEPRWGGSIEAMQALATDIRRHLRENSLLYLLLDSITAEKADMLDDGPDEPNYRYVFDEASESVQLSRAAWNANRRDRFDVAVVLMTEALRFVPNDPDLRSQRAFDLTSLGYDDWAMAEASRILHEHPDDVLAYDTCAVVDEHTKQFPRAAQALQQGLKVDKDDLWTLIELANVEVIDLKDWAAGKPLVDALVDRHPDEPSGWILRALIQQHEHDPAMGQTIDHYLGHFSGHADQAYWVQRMRAMKQTQ